MTEHGDLTLTMSLEERELLMRLLTEQMEHGPIERVLFNALVQLRAKIGGHLDQ